MREHQNPWPYIAVGKAGVMRSACYHVNRGLSAHDGGTVHRFWSVGVRASIMCALASCSTDAAPFQAPLDLTSFIRFHPSRVSPRAAAGEAIPPTRFTGVRRLSAALAMIHHLFADSSCFVPMQGLSTSLSMIHREAPAGVLALRGLLFEEVGSKLLSWTDRIAYQMVYLR